MPTTRTTITGQRAPCGQIMEAERLQDRDDQCLVTDEVFYACGCVSIHHEYHDGSVARKVVHHDGTVLVDEIIAEH